MTFCDIGPELKAPTPRVNHPEDRYFRFEQPGHNPLQCLKPLRAVLKNPPPKEDPPRSSPRWPRQRIIKFGAAFLILGFFGLNILAYRHADAMTHFIPAGHRTNRPEELTTTAKIRTLLTGVSLPRPINRSSPESLGLPFETVSFPGAHDINLEAWLIRSEERAGIVALFHGYGGAKDSLLPAAKEFHNLGLTTLLVDFHGSGGSGGDSTSIGWHEADDVVATATWARDLEPDQRLYLHGISLGAVAILRATGSLGLEADGIILESPFDRMQTTVKRRFNAMGVPSFPSAQLLVFWGGVQHGFNGFAHNPIDYAEKTDCPAIILLGEKDPRVTVADGTRLAGALRATTDLVVFETAGHAQCQSNDPTKWRKSVAQFLAAP